MKTEKIKEVIENIKKLNSNNNKIRDIIANQKNLVQDIEELMIYLGQSINPKIFTKSEVLIRTNKTTNCMLDEQVELTNQFKEQLSIFGSYFESFTKELNGDPFSKNKNKG